ncbi:hypothetical protein PF008_g17892 [Phytophthora fragariae]|uniref:GH10 domain-containing protein n=1 Tax=Phytophthora fragariae TaxID=53985 RepID=A0A6G0R6X6_9STRA|nr:hypothetical protein PF008_g17892 [Phytophthora fragariae]
MSASWINEELQEPNVCGQGLLATSHYTGTNYTTTAFKTANKVNKSLELKTKRYYNDYNTNSVNANSTAVLGMIQTQQLDASICIDGLEFQSHSSYSDTATTEDMVTNLERFAALGLDVAFTEHIPFW